MCVVNNSPFFNLAKEDYNRINGQLRECQRKMDSLSRDLENKDNLNKQLKMKIGKLEDDFEATRQEINEITIARDSMHQQKLDVEKQLKVHHQKITKVEESYESMQIRKTDLQTELVELKKQLMRLVSGEDATNQVKTQLQTEVCKQLYW